MCFFWYPDYFLGILYGFMIFKNKCLDYHKKYHGHPPHNRIYADRNLILINIIFLFFFIEKMAPATAMYNYETEMMNNSKRILDSGKALDAVDKLRLSCLSKG